MSAMARFIKVPRVALSELRDAAVPRKRGFFGGSKDIFEDVLGKHGRVVAQYKWSGYVLSAVLPYLQSERNIDLTQSELNELSAFLSRERRATVYFLTHTHRNTCLAALSADIPEAEIGAYYNELMGHGDREAAKPMLDGVCALRESLAAVDENSVVLLCIG